MHMEGIFTPIITPFHDDGSIDRESYAEVIEFLIEAGVHCIVAGDSTGEYYAQTMQERMELMCLTTDILNKRAPLMVGVGATRTEEAITLAEAAKAAGADALLVNSSPYAVPNDLENAMHALQIDRAVNMPIMLYNKLYLLYRSILSHNEGLTKISIKVGRGDETLYPTDCHRFKLFRHHLLFPDRATLDH